MSAIPHEPMHCVHAAPTAAKYQTPDAISYGVSLLAMLTFNQSVHPKQKAKLHDAAPPLYLNILTLPISVTS